MSRCLFHVGCEDRHPDASALRLKLILALIAHNPKHPLLEPATWIEMEHGAPTCCLLIDDLQEHPPFFCFVVFSTVSTPCLDIYIQDNKLIGSDYYDYLIKLTHISQSCQLQLREEGADQRIRS